MKNTELRALIREQVKAVLKEANEMSFINKARAKSSLEQIKKGKRSDGMGKFDAKVYAIKGTQEIELKDPSDLAKYSVGYKYGLKSESKITEAVNIQNDEAAIKALEDVAANWTSSNKAHFLELLNQVIDYFHKTKLGESKINEATMVSFADYYRAYGRDVKAAAVFLDQTIESAGIDFTEELFDAVTDLVDEVRADQDAEI